MFHFYKTRLTITLFFFFSVHTIFAQVCTTLGQNPESAFPVCGTSIFKQGIVPICGDKKIPAPCQSGSGALITDKNPFWYSISCFQEGSLGFIITPDINQEDYDWQLFDVTNAARQDVYTNAALFVACNWSGEFGNTGTSNSGLRVNVCEGLGQPLFSSMPVLKKGHQYLLLVSHFSDTQSGYTLLFAGGTAVITDPLEPALKQINAVCTNEITIPLNKKMKCSSLSTNGSEFSIVPALSSIVSARGNLCSNGFEMDSVTLTLQQELPPGKYSLLLKNGTDNNTLLDICGRSIPAGSSLTFNKYESVNATFDHQLFQGCVSDTLILNHSGGNGINQWLWTFDRIERNENAQVTKIYQTAGTKNVRLTVSNGHCFDSAQIDFLLEAKLSARFETLSAVCPEDSVSFKNLSTGNPIYWDWDFNNGNRFSQVDPPAQFYQPGTNDINYFPSLSIRDAKGCTSKTSVAIKVLSNCRIDIPSAFTPNGDGLNDFLYPLNAIAAKNLVFKIYNRYGQMVFETHDWQRKWDGTVAGIAQGNGTFTWTISYQIEGKENTYFKKGIVELIR